MKEVIPKRMRKKRLEIYPGKFAKLKFPSRNVKNKKWKIYLKKKEKLLKLILEESNRVNILCRSLNKSEEDQEQMDGGFQEYTETYARALKSNDI